MFESGVIITGGKRRSDINATYASRDGAITPSRSVVAARESLSGVFRGALRLIALGLVARSAGGPTFCRRRPRQGRGSKRSMITRKRRELHLKKHCWGHRPVFQEEYQVKERHWYKYLDNIATV